MTADNQHAHTYDTVRELGDAAAEAGVTAAELIQRSGPQRVPSEPGA